jgi:hypothetical protein
MRYSTKLLSENLRRYIANQGTDERIILNECEKVRIYTEFI